MKEAPANQDKAWSNGAVRIPDDINIEICEATNSGYPTGWPEFYDRHGEIWWETTERHDGDVVMLPGSDWEPMLRRDVLAEYGPLVTSEQYTEYLAALNHRAALAYAAKASAEQ